MLWATQSVAPLSSAVSAVPRSNKYHCTSASAWYRSVAAPEALLRFRVKIGAQSGMADALQSVGPRAPTMTHLVGGVSSQGRQNEVPRPPRGALAASGDHRMDAGRRADGQATSRALTVVDSGISEAARGYLASHGPAATQCDCASRRRVPVPVLNRGGPRVRRGPRPRTQEQE